jgi:hypothetical protein
MTGRSSAPSTRMIDKAAMVWAIAGGEWVMVFLLGR